MDNKGSENLCIFILFSYSLRAFPHLFLIAINCIVENEKFIEKKNFVKINCATFSYFQFLFPFKKFPKGITLCIVYTSFFTHFLRKSTLYSQRGQFMIFPLLQSKWYLFKNLSPKRFWKFYLSEKVVRGEKFHLRWRKADSY